MPGMVFDCIFSWSTRVTFPFGEVVVEVSVHCESLPTIDFVAVSETVLFPTVDGAGEGSV